MTLANEFNVNTARTAPRTIAKHEGDAVNDQGDERFLEDKVYLLQMALVKRHIGCFAYLLDVYSYYWPPALFDVWFKPILFHQAHFFDLKYFQEVIQVFLRSRTCRSVFAGLTTRK